MMLSIVFADGDWWYVIEGQLEKGQMVELWRDGQIHRWDGNALRSALIMLTIDVCMCAGC